MVKNGLPVQETRVPSLEKEMATHSSVLAWEVPGTEEPGWLQSMESLNMDLFINAESIN